MYTSSERGLEKMLIHLPSDCESIQCWKVKSGEAVRKGEIIALARRKEAPASLNQAGRGFKTNLNSRVQTKSLLGMIQAQNKLHDTAVGKLSENDRERSISSKTPLKFDFKNRSSSISSQQSKNDVGPLVKVLSPSDGLIELCFGSSVNVNGSDRILLGYVEPCQHHTLIDGMCVICGQAILGKQVVDEEKVPGHISHNPIGQLQDEERLSSEDRKASHTHLLEEVVYHETNENNINLCIEDSEMEKNMTPVTISGGITMRLSQDEASKITSQNRRKLLSAKKLSLVLDLDHTLVHATGDPRAAIECELREDVRLILLPPTPNGIYLPGTKPLRHFVKMRPFLKDFILGLMDKFEISIYTAGTRAYALQISRIICRYVVDANVDEEEFNHIVKCVDELKETLNTKVKKSQEKLDSQERKQSQHDSDVEETEQHVCSRAMEESDSDCHEDAKKSDDSVKVEPKRGPAENLQSGLKRKALKAVSSEMESKRKRRVSFAQELTREKTYVPFREVKEESVDDIEAQVKKLEAQITEVKHKEMQARELEKKLFSNRIISRCDVGDLGRDVKSVKRVFPCGGMTVSFKAFPKKNVVSGLMTIARCFFLGCHRG